MFTLNIFRKNFQVLCVLKYNHTNQIFVINETPHNATQHKATPHNATQHKAT